MDSNETKIYRDKNSGKMAESSKNSMNSLSVIIPAYNEEKIIGLVLDEIDKALRECGFEYEIIVVDDGSRDGTAQMIDREKVRFIKHEVNRGYGSALKTGINHAKHEICLITDADGTYPCQDISKLVNLLKENDLDMVVGSRTGEKVSIPAIRKPAKWILNKLANYLSETKIPDLNSGLRVFYRSTCLKYTHILPNKFSWTSTITLAYLSDGYTIHYEPINYERRAGRSKVKPIDALNFLILLIRTISYFNPLKIFLPVSLFLLFFSMCKLVYDIFYLKNLTDSVTLLFLSGLQIGFIGVLADVYAKARK